MKIQDTFTYDDIAIVYRTSMLEQSLYVLWSTQFRHIAEENPELQYFDIFLNLAAAIVEVTGIDWQRPRRDVDEDGIIQSYLSLMGQITLPLFNEFFAAVNALNSPLSDELERTDDTLTEEQKKTAT